MRVMQMQRRLVLLGAMALLGVGLSPADARPRRAGPAAAVVVDVSALRAKGLTVEADIVQATIANEIARTGPYPGRVYVRIQGLSLNAFAGSSSISSRTSGGSGGMSSDYMDGDFQVLGPRGEVLSGQPLVVNAPASSGGAWYLPGNEQRRIEAISRSFAGWVRQYAN